MVEQNIVTKFKINVMNLPNEGLPDLLRNSLSLVESSHSEVEHFLRRLDHKKYTLVYVLFFTAKLRTENRIGEITKLLNKLEEKLSHFDFEQIWKAFDLCIHLCVRVQKVCLRHHLYHVGIRILKKCIDLFLDDKNVITPLEALFFSLCLKDCQYEIALPYLEDRTILQCIFRDLEWYDDSYWVRLYLFYGGLIYAALDRLDDSAHFMGLAATFDSSDFSGLSMISVTAFKHFILLSIMAPKGAFKRLSPNFKVNHFNTHAVDYTSIAKVAGGTTKLCEKIKKIERMLHNKFMKFTADNTVGLIRRLLKFFHECTILNIAEHFKVISIEDIKKHCPFETDEHLFNFLQRMQAEKKLHVSIDEETQLISFKEVEESLSIEELDASFGKTFSLASTLFQSHSAIGVRSNTDESLISRAGFSQCLSKPKPNQMKLEFK